MSQALTDYFQQFRNSPYYAQSFNYELQRWNTKQVRYKFDHKQPDACISAPEINFTIQAECLRSINNDLQKSTKNRQGILISYCPNLALNRIHYYNSSEEDDIGAIQEAEQCFCIGFFVLKNQQYINQIGQRIANELKRCLNRRLGAVYNRNCKQEDSLSQFDEISKIKYKNTRIFLIFQKSKKGTIIHKIMYYPNVILMMKKMHLTPQKYIKNEVLDNALKFNTHFEYGYLTFGKNGSELRIMLTDKLDAELQKSQIIGVWIAAHFVSKSQKQQMLWALIMEYLTNCQIKKKISVNAAKTGIVLILEKMTKSTYLFEVNESGKWELMSQSQVSHNLPTQFKLSTHNTIIEEQREQSEKSSVVALQKVKVPQYEVNSFEEGIRDQTDIKNLKQDGFDKWNKNKGYQTYDEKDLKIRLLQQQLQFYKHKCDELQTINNNNLLYIQSIHTMQIMNQQYGTMNKPIINKPDITGVIETNVINPLYNNNNIAPINNNNQTTTNNIPNIEIASLSTTPLQNKKLTQNIQLINHCPKQFTIKNGEQCDQSLAPMFGIQNSITSQNDFQEPLTGQNLFHKKSGVKNKLQKPCSQHFSKNNEQKQFFIIRDNKNISFAQQSLLDDSSWKEQSQKDKVMYRSPEFKSVSLHRNMTLQQQQQSEEDTFQNESQQMLVYKNNTYQSAINNINIQLTPKNHNLEKDIMIDKNNFKKKEQQQRIQNIQQIKSINQKNINQNIRKYKINDSYQSNENIHFNDQKNKNNSKNNEIIQSINENNNNKIFIETNKKSLQLKDSILDSDSDSDDDIEVKNIIKRKYKI